MIRIVFIVIRTVRLVIIAAVTIRIALIVIRTIQNVRCLVRRIRPISRNFPLLIGSFIIKNPLYAVLTAGKSARRRNVRRRPRGIVRPPVITLRIKNRIGFAGL
jgi:hypothetical protein